MSGVGVDLRRQELYYITSYALHMYYSFQHSIYHIDNLVKFGQTEKKVLLTLNLYPELGIS